MRNANKVRDMSDEWLEEYLPGEGWNVPEGSVATALDHDFNFALVGQSGVITPSKRAERDVDGAVVRTLNPVGKIIAGAVENGSCQRQAGPHHPGCSQLAAHPRTSDLRLTIDNHLSLGYYTLAKAITSLQSQNQSFLSSSAYFHKHWDEMRRVAISWRVQGVGWPTSGCRWRQLLALETLLWVFRLGYIGSTAYRAIDCILVRTGVQNAKQAYHWLQAVSGE